MIEGCWATLLLPLREDESIDYDVLAEETAALIDAGMSGIYSNGTAGEFISLSEEEFIETTAVFAPMCRMKGMPFQIGCSNPSAQTMLSRIEIAKRYEPDAMQVVLPEWFPVSMTEAEAFLRRASERAEGIPLTLYNPPNAKRRLTPDEFLRLLDAVEGIGSIKVMDGDDEWYDEMQEVMQRTSVFIPGHHMATGIRHGAKGSYSNVACLSPRRAQLWYETIKKDPDEGMRLEREIRGFMESKIRSLIRSGGYANFVLDKFMASVGGWCGIRNIMRFPYRRVNPEMTGYIRERLIESAPFFADDAIYDRELGIRRK